MSPQDLCREAGIVFDFHAKDHIGPPYSHIWVGLIFTTIIVLIYKCSRHRSLELQRATAADAVMNHNAPLEVGARFIRGRVELAEAASQAVSVHIEQKGTQISGKNGISHKWTEVRRKTYAEPFYVRCANGDRVRVEPDKDVLLVDDPDKLKQDNRKTRTRIANLSAGETVIVEGVLSRGHDPEGRNHETYRGHAQDWVMRPPSNGRMQLSAENLGDRHRLRAGQYFSTLKRLLGILAIIHASCMFYHGGLLFGTDTCARITSHDSYVSKNSKGQPTTHYRLMLDVPWPSSQTFSRNFAQDDWIQVDRGAIVAFRRVPTWDFMSIPGYGTSVHFYLALVASIAAVVGVSIYRQTLSSRRWYEGRLDDSGPGPLSQSPDPQKLVDNPKRQRPKKKRSAPLQ